MFEGAGQGGVPIVPSTVVSAEAVLSLATVTRVRREVRGMVPGEGVGSYTYTATVTDKAGNKIKRTAKYDVTYRWDAPALEDACRGADLMGYVVDRLQEPVLRSFSTKKQAVSTSSRVSLSPWATKNGGACIPSDDRGSAPYWWPCSRA